MNEFAQTLAAKSDQINNTDLTGGSQTIKITKINVNLREDQPVSMSFAGSDKVYRPCKGMRRLMAEVWGVDPAAYIGRSLTLYRDPDVRFGADTTGGTRISHMSHIDAVKKITVPVSRGKVKQYHIKPLEAAHDAPHDALAIAKAAAAKGKDGFTEWWNSDEGKLCRPALRDHLDELRGIASAASSVADDEPPM